MNTMAERIQTVLGTVNPKHLGRTLTHEHLSMDFSYLYRKPPAILADKFQPNFSLETIGYVRQYPYSSPYNLIFNDEATEAAVINDVKEYKRCGGATIVENSTQGLKRDVTFYKKVSQETGVNIVAGTGYYIADMQKSCYLDLRTDEMYNHMLEEMTICCSEDLTVKAGFIGEIASVWPLKEFERTAIKAAGELQNQIRCAVSFHPHRNPEAPFEIIRLYLESGGSADKVVMSHLDRTLLKDDQLLEFAELGTYCQFDLFGVEVSLYQLHTQTNMPSDAQRLDKIKLLLAEGKEDKILISHDIHTKHRLIDFGGHGYSHILTNVLPRMRANGISQDTIDKITIENPSKWLTISPS